MKFELTPYQAQAADQVTTELLEGFRRYDENGKRKAVSLSAPTGAGKTVIATKTIESLWYRTDLIDPIPDLTVLWVTDDPSLNEQTKRKMLVASSQIKPRQLISVDQSFDQYTFGSGSVYFVHIQQLGKGATNYVEKSDRRTYPLWETIANTVRERGHELVLIVDEAHRGTSSKTNGKKTITSQLIDGAQGKLPPTPVVLGISATPKKFVDAVTSVGGRTLEWRKMGRFEVEGTQLADIAHELGIMTSHDPSLERIVDLIFEPMNWEDPRFVKLRDLAGWTPPHPSFQPPPPDVSLTINITGQTASG